MLLLEDRIRAVRKKLGVNQQGLADIIGSSDGKVKAWEQGNTLTIKSKDILLLSNKYGFNPEWLEYGTGDMMLDKGELLLADIARTEALLSDTIAIPYFTDVISTADGKPHDHSYIKLMQDFLPKHSKELEAIRINGNSMDPTILDQDIIFVDKEEREPVNGKIYLVFLCDEVYIKRIFIEPVTKEILLKSDNPIFPQFKADCSDFKIIGRVIANMHITRL